MFLSGLGGAFGYLTGAMDWGHSALGVLLGSEYHVIYFFSALTWCLFLTVHLFSIPEKALSLRYKDATPPDHASLLSGTAPDIYGALSENAEPTSELRSRSSSALSEAQSITSSSKRPSGEVRLILCTCV